MTDSGPTPERRARRMGCLGLRLRLGRCLRLARQEAGFTLIELLVATIILAIAAGPLVVVLNAAGTSQRLSARRTTADQLAAAEIERIRALPYFRIGISGGNPSGGLAAQTTGLSVAGTPVKMTRQVVFVDDMVANQTQTYAEYKKVTVTVNRASDNMQLANKVTYVSATSTQGSTKLVRIKVQVLDYVLNTGLAGATVNLLNGPSAPRNDVTNPVGQAVFPELTPNPTGVAYSLTATLAGYTTLPDDVPTAGNTFNLSPPTTQTSTIRMYKPATLVISLQNNTGSAWGSAATVNVSSARGVSSYAYVANQGIVTIANVVPGLTYTVGAQTGTAGWAAPGQALLVPQSYPNNLTRTFVVAFQPVAVTRTLQVSVRKGGVAVPSAAVQVQGGPSNVLLTGTTNASGVAVFAVPSGSATYTASAQSAGATGTTSGISVPAGSTPVSATVNVA